MSRKIIDIEVERIHPNLRMIYSLETLEGLCRFIQSGGRIDPVDVWFDGECFRIQDGEKRWRACRILGITYIRARVIEIS